jgi:hypothetical protein
MSTINTILIKRRLASSNLNSVPSLSGGELAFSEKNNTFYYGSETGTLEVGGSGAFLTRNTAQTASGDKTFTGSTTLSSTTFSSNSLIDVGSNKITNLAEPSTSTDATTRNYVDNAISNLASNGGTAVTSLSTEVYNTFIKLTDDRAVNLTGGLTVNTVNATGNASVGGNLTVTGDLSVLGATTTLETTTTLTSAFAVTNAGSGPALVVTQTGSNDIATFYDDANTALIIKDGGLVGINKNNPTEALDVSGNIYATGSATFHTGLTVHNPTSLDSGSITTNGSGSLTASELNATTLNIAGITSLDSGDITTDGTGTLNIVTLNASDDINASGDLTISGRLTSDGGNITTDGAGNINVSTLNANANIWGGALTIVGATTLDDGNITTSGAGNLSLAGSISVAGGVLATDISGNLTTSGNITGNGTTTITNFVIDGGSF